MPTYNEASRNNRLDSMTETRVPAAGQGGAGDRPAADPFDGRTALREACLIRVDRIVADPGQPRSEFDADSLGRLASSLKERGQLQPIRVRWDGDNDRYVIVVGERRWRAAKLAGLERVACVVSERATSEEILEDQLVENCLRDDLQPVEQARAYRSLLDRSGLTYRQLADRLHVSIGAISQAVALLELPTPVRESIDRGEIPAYTGYQIARRTGDAGERTKLAEREVARRKRPNRAASRPRPWTFAGERVQVVVTALADDVTEDELTEGLKAALAARRKGKGKVRAA